MDLNSAWLKILSESTTIPLRDLSHHTRTTSPEVTTTGPPQYFVPFTFLHSAPRLMHKSEEIAFGWWLVVLFILFKFGIFCFFIFSYAFPVSRGNKHWTCGDHFSLFYFLGFPKQDSLGSGFRFCRLTSDAWYGHGTHMTNDWHNYLWLEGLRKWQGTRTTDLVFLYRPPRTMQHTQVTPDVRKLPQKMQGSRLTGDR